MKDAAYSAKELVAGEAVRNYERFLDRWRDQWRHSKHYSCPPFVDKLSVDLTGAYRSLLTVLSEEVGEELSRLSMLDEAVKNYTNDEPKVRKIINKQLPTAGWTIFKRGKRHD